MSYLRWILTQKFPSEYIEYAKEKTSKNKSDNLSIEITRHATDSFSLRFIDKWDKSVGLGSFLAQMAHIAFEKGTDVSKSRHQDENIIKEYDGIKWVFNKDVEQRVLVTVM